MRQPKRLSVTNGLLCLGAMSLMASNANAISIDNWKDESEVTKAYFKVPKYWEALEKSVENKNTLGRARRTIAFYTSVLDNGKTGVELAINSPQGIVSHSQASGVQGYTLVVWDGSSKVVKAGSPETVNPQGLNGIDFTTDGSTKIILKFTDVVEFKNDKVNASIALTIYDYDTSQAYEVKKYAADVKEKIVNITEENPNGDIAYYYLEFNFTEFGYDFENVGAVTLKIDGQDKESAGLDVSLGEISTDGCQNFVPDAGYVKGYASVEAKKQGSPLVCCQVKDLCDICGGDSSSCTDCAGVVNGTKKTDECGKCLEPDDANWNVSCSDCAGVPNGTKKLDKCDKCLEPNDPTRDMSCQDCAGVPNGTKKLDECDECFEPDDPRWNTTCTDCAGEIHGTHVKDACGICSDQPEYGTKSCYDCAGVKDGKHEKDSCGQCLLKSDPNWNESCRDCAGVLGGKAKKDDCGVCLEETDPTWNTACLDCAGIVNGTHQMDECGVCDTDPLYGQKSCYDCAGVINGSYKIDSCGVCLDPNDSQWNESCRDCAGVLFGKYAVDACGECKDPYGSDWNMGASSKYGCTVVTHSGDLKDADNWITQQQVNYKALLGNRHYCLTNKEKKQLKTKSVKILASAKATISSYPTTSSVCTNADADHCTSYSLKGDNDTLLSSIKQLRKKSLQALNARKNCLGEEQGACEGGYEACYKRMRQRYRAIREEKQNVNKLAKNAKESIGNLPSIANACYCEEVNN